MSDHSLLQASDETEIRSTDDSSATDEPWVVCRVGHCLLGFEASSVESMVQLPPITRVPKSSEHVRGVINLRGAIVRVLDLRLSLDLESLTEERRQLSATLETHAESHRKWVEAAQNGRPVDNIPSADACPFEQWRSQFRTENIVLEGLVQRLAAPHQRLHEALKGLTGAPGAETDISRELEVSMSEFLSGLQMIQRAVMESTREIAVVLHNESRRAAAVVDEVISVEPVRPLDNDAPGSNHQDLLTLDFIDQLAKRAREEQLLLMVKAEQLVVES